MTISLNASFLDKSLSNFTEEASSVSPNRKSLCKQTQSVTMLLTEESLSLPLRSVTRQGCSLNLLLFHVEPEISARAVIQAKETCTPYNSVHETLKTILGCVLLL